MNPPTTSVYMSTMQKRGLQPEIVSLPHNTEGFWLGNKNAKNVVIYFHGTSATALYMRDARYPDRAFRKPKP
jgi:hypothetical protein